MFSICEGYTGVFQKKQRSILVHALWYTAFLFRNTQQRGFEDKTENSALLKSWLKLRLCTNFLFIRFKCSVSTKIHLVSMYTLWYNLKTLQTRRWYWFCGIIWGPKTCLLGHLSPCRADSMICPFFSREHRKMLLGFLPRFQWMKRGNHIRTSKEFILRLHAA